MAEIDRADEPADQEADEGQAGRFCVQYWSLGRSMQPVLPP